MNPAVRLLLVDKPKGITSFDVIRILRRKLGALNPAGRASKMGHAPKKLKLGHAGTLDPAASGLMLIGVGEGTKDLARLIKLPKMYEAAILLGVRTASGDLEGEVLETALVGAPDEGAVWEVIAGLVGTLELPVPIYSALKRGGEPLYKKARRGEAVEAPVRAMEVRGAEYLDMVPSERGPVVRARFDVGSGTYIRSLAEEVGRRLGVPATLADLRRTRIGEYDIRDAITLDTI